MNSCIHHNSLEHICLKCKRILQDDDIASLLPSDGSPMNDLDYLCQACSKSTNKLVKSSIGIASSSNADEGLFYYKY